MALVGRNLSVAVGGVTYLDDVSFDFKPGRIYLVIGRTGAGKTSLMRAIAGLLPLDQGTIEFDETDITFTPVWERDCAIVYQQFINYPNKTVRKNVEFPLRKKGLSGEELNTRVDTYLSKVGLTGFEDRKPSELSGGQQQRVALARSLARKSRILMLDEPLMNLDFKLREQLRVEFRSLFTGEKNSVTIYATTEVSEAMMLGDEILVMHEGRILQAGPPEQVFEWPKNKLVAQTLSDPPMSIIPVSIRGSEILLEDGSSLNIPSHLQHLGDGSYELGLRANNIHLSGGSNVSGVIEFVEVSGSETVLSVDTSVGQLVVQIEGIFDYYAGQKVECTIDTEQVFAFDLDGTLVSAPSVEVK
jgi:glycerol transport system ATP-binding protein